MRLNRQIILLFFLSSIVNRQSSIVKVSSIVKAWRVQGCRPRAQGSSGPGQAVQVKRSKGPRSKGQAVQGSKGQARTRTRTNSRTRTRASSRTGTRDQNQQQDQTSPADPCRGPGPGPGPKVYIWNATAPQKINKKYFRVKVAIGKARRIFEPTNNPNP
jgi:hypothetical protein